MSSHDESLQLKNLCCAMDINDTESIRTIFLHNPRLLYRTESDSSFLNLRSDLLFQASMSDNDEIIDLYLMFLNYESNELLHFILAIFKGNVRLVELMLSVGAKLEGPNKKEYLHHVYSSIFRRTKTRKEMLTLLIKYGQLTVGFDGRTALHDYVIYSINNEDDSDDHEVVEILIDSGIHVDAVDDEGTTPLHLVLESGTRNVGLLSYLINKGADVNLTGENDESPLSLAATLDNVKMVDLLLSKGANIKYRNKYGNTALHEACFSHAEKPISFLISANADVSVENNFGETPLARLMSDEDIYDEEDEKARDQCAPIMIKEIAKLSFENLPTSKSNSGLIQNSLVLKKIFQSCLKELAEMKNKKFYAGYSYHYILKMSTNIKKLAQLTKNHEFVLKFELNLKSFSNYENDLRKILEEAVQEKNRLYAVEARLKSILCNCLPDIVVRNLAKNLILEDLPL